MGQSTGPAEDMRGAEATAEVMVGVMAEAAQAAPAAASTFHSSLPPAVPPQERELVFATIKTKSEKFSVLILRMGHFRLF